MFNPYVALGGLLAVIALVVGSFFYGEHVERLSYEAAASAAKSAVIDEVHVGDLVTQTVSQADAAAIQQIQTVTQTLIREVPVYVTAKAAARCTIPRGFVRLHNAAASGVPPIPRAAGQSDDDPASTDLAAVGSTVTGNYGICSALRQQLIDLNDWIKAEAALGPVK